MPRQTHGATCTIGQDAMISHDAFMLIIILVEHGGQATLEQLTFAVEKRVDKHKDKLWIEGLLKQLIEAKLIQAMLIEANISLYKLIDATKFIKAYQNYNKPINKASIKAYRSAVENLLTKNVKMANPRYRSVVQGKRARKSPLQEFAEKNLSRQDLSRFWEEVGEMTDEERRDFADKIAQLAHRSSRD